jgi:hypothetical protein
MTPAEMVELGRLLEQRHTAFRRRAARLATRSRALAAEHQARALELEQRQREGAWVAALAVHGRLCRLTRRLGWIALVAARATAVTEQLNRECEALAAACAGHLMKTPNTRDAEQRLSN